MIKLRRGVPVALAAGLVLAVAGASAGADPAASPHVCSGTFSAPGVLRGAYPNGVVVNGLCAVPAGPARVTGRLVVTNGSALVAAFGANHSSLTVTGNLILDPRSVVLLGCKQNPNGTGMACLDQPKSGPLLTSHGSVGGSIIARSALGLIVHNSSIGRHITDRGGGGGVTCAVPKSGIFGPPHNSPVFSDLEDSSVGGGVTMSGIRTCWFGLARDTIGRSTTITTNVLADPDGIEILANHIANDLSCRGNRHPNGGPKGSFPVWNSADTSKSGALYPRVSEPNTVGGERSGQCVTASPIKLGGPPAAKHF